MTGWRQCAMGVMIGVLAAPTLAGEVGENTATASSPALANGSIAIVPLSPQSHSEPPPSAANTDPPMTLRMEPASSNDSSSSLQSRSASSATSADSVAPESTNAIESSPLESQPLGKQVPLPVRKTGLGGADRAVLGRESNTAGLSKNIVEFAKVGGALVVVIGLAFSVRAILRRAGGIAAGGARPSGVVEILARYPIPGARARGQQLIVIKFARRLVLAHASGNSMTSLCEMSEPDEVAAVLARLEAGANPKAAEKFRQNLQQFQAEHRTTKVRESERLIPSQGDAAEVVDLTRSAGRGFLGLLGGQTTK